MAPTKADETGAEFEENLPQKPRKVIVNSRQRVAKPEYNGEPDEEPTSEEPKQEEPKKSYKSNKIEPDISLEGSKLNQKSEAKSEGSDQAAIDELAKTASDQKAAKNTQDESANDKATQSLIENKTYFVPIGQVTKRRNTMIFVIILLLIVAAAVAAYFVLAG